MDANDNTEDLRACARRKLKAAVYVIGLMLASAAPEKDSGRVLGTKYHPRRQATASGTEMEVKARRAFKAAVLAVVATQRLGHLRVLKRDPMFSYQYLYRDPVYDWEDKTIPASKPLLTREASGDVDELLPSGSKRRLQDAVMDLLTMTELSYAMDANMHPRSRFHSMERLQNFANVIYGDNAPVQKEKLQDAVMDILTSVKLSHALGENVHPRNRFHSLALITALQPWLCDVLQSQEDYRQLQCRLAMKHKLRAAIWAVLAVNRMEEHVKAARAANKSGKRKLRAAILAFLAVKRMEERAKAARANTSGKHKLRAAILAVVALKRLEERSRVARAMQALKRRIGRVKAERKIRKNLSWFGSSMNSKKHPIPRRVLSGPLHHLQKPLPGQGSSTLDTTEHTEISGELDCVESPFDVVRLAE
jgi:hypothetical protein